MFVNINKSHMKRNFITVLSIALGLTIFSSCESNVKVENTTEETSTNKTKEDSGKMDAMQELQFKLDLVILNNLMVPISIIEDLKKEEKSLYHENYINSLENVAKYEDEFTQALNFGIYGMDILYNAAHDHTAEIADYKTKTRPLAESLGLIEIYRDEDMEKFKLAATDHTTMMDFIVDEYDKVDHFMVENGQHNTLLLSITGAVLESMYFTGMAIEEYGMSDLKYSLLCNERNILNQIISLYDYFPNDERKMALKTELQTIQKDFNSFKSREDLTDERAHQLDEDIITLRNRIINNEL